MLDFSLISHEREEPHEENALKKSFCCAVINGTGGGQQGNRQYMRSGKPEGAWVDFSLLKKAGFSYL
jgi:hypothetical protein